MIKLSYSIQINANVERDFNQMLGLSDLKTYENWTKAFNPTSTYQGNWNEGEKMLFIGTSENGKVGGMVSRVKTLTQNEFSSLEHYGMYQDGKEILEGPEIDAWKGSLENYRFKTNDGGTLLEIEIDSAEDFKDYFDEKWPLALAALKQQ